MTTGRMVIDEVHRLEVKWKTKTKTKNNTGGWCALGGVWRLEMIT